MVAVVVGSLSPVAAMATEFDFSFMDQDFGAVLNQTIVAGVAFRIEPQDSRLIGKSNINPNVCAGVYQTCQGLHREQIYPAQQLRRSPGAASINFDDGNLNFDRGDVTQSPIVWTHDLKIESGDFGFFYRGRAVYDPALYHLKTNRPNVITSGNFASVGNQTPGSPSNRYFVQTFGPGAQAGGSLAEAEAQQIGLRYQFLDTNFFGSIPLPGDRDLQFRIGRQTVQWGESTVAILNSINQAQPISANNFYRYGNGLLEDLYIPVNMFRLSTNITDGLSVEGYYQFESRVVEVPTPGTFNSFVDLGTTNLRNFVNASFGSAADDFDQQAGGILDNDRGYGAHVRDSLAVCTERVTKMLAENDPALLTLTMTAGTATESLVTSEVLDLTSAGNVNFSALLTASETSAGSNFETTDKFKAVLIIDGGAPVNLIEPFDRGDLLAGERSSRRDASARRLAVDQHRAGAAGGDTATEFRAGELQVLTQIPEQGAIFLARILLFLAVDRKLHGNPPPSAMCWMCDVTRSPARFGRHVSICSRQHK